MAKMRAVDAAMYVLEKEGITTAFGVPGAAINPFYSAMRKHGGIRHILARHVRFTMWKVLRTWRKVIPAQRQGISAYVWGLPVLRART